MRGVKGIEYLAPSSTPEPAISLEFLVWAPVLLFSIVAHEYAHAEAAYRQGDDTAYLLGRITFNPLKHIDPFMSVIFPALLALAGAPPFGAAKPVPVNPRNYRHYVRVGDQLLMVDGPARRSPGPVRVAVPAERLKVFPQP